MAQRKDELFAELLVRRLDTLRSLVPRRVTGALGASPVPPC